VERAVRASSVLILALGLWAWAGAAAAEPGLREEVARLRAALGQSAAQEQQCLAAAARPVWAAPLAEDVRMLRERARQASDSDGGAWKELLRKAEELEAQARENARTGADLLTTQYIGLGCLERYGAQREALRASLELALQEPAAYLASLAELRAHGTAPLLRDLAALRQSELRLAAALRAQAPDAELAPAARALGPRLGAFQRRHVAALESEANRALAEPVLRAGTALVATFEARERERLAAQRAQSTEGAERQAALRERDDAARQRQARLEAAERLLAATAALNSE
jgi:hypothetical protein